MNQLENQPQQPNISQEPQPTIHSETPQKPSLPTWLIILITVLVVAVIGVGVYATYHYYYTSESNESLSNEQEEINPSQLPSEEIVDETTDWQTYRNEKYGYEVKYPRDFELRIHPALDHKKAAAISIVKQKATIAITVDSYYQGLSIEQSFEKVKNSYRKVIEHGYTSIDNKKAYRAIGESLISGLRDNGEFNPILTIWISHNNKIYCIEYLEWQNTNIADWQYYNVFNQILSTFKFIEVIDRQKTMTPPEKICFDNGGEFLIRNGANFCVFSDGKECSEFGYNKCVESKGNWQPTSVPPSGMD